MTLITPDKDRPDFGAQVKRIKSALNDLEKQLEGLAEQARAGEVTTPKEADKIVTEVRHWMRHALETEKALDEYSRRETGITNGYALDLAEAKRTIGCRLARIAPCCQARRVAD